MLHPGTISEGCITIDLGNDAAQEKYKKMGLRQCRQ
jgi:hypothetical protein